jgi:energy-coupling factor transport system ATP-binding protein
MWKSMEAGVYMSDEREPLIRVEHVSFGYTMNDKRTLPVLRDISFEVRRGEYLAIIGHNGSGKSTLAKHLNGLLVPQQGNVWVAGMNTKDKGLRKEIRKCVGMVFQHPDNQIVATIVEDDVAFGLENIGVPADEMRQRVDEALQMVGMFAFRHRPPHHLSGGQKQRIAISGILAMRPACIVLDEATSMLDSYGRQDILRVMRALHQQGMTIVTVTHHMSEVVEADRVIVMEAGRIVMEGTPRDVFQQQERLHELQLGIPDASRISQAVHRVVPAFSGTLIRTDEVVEEVENMHLRTLEVHGG